MPIGKMSLHLSFFNQRLVVVVNFHSRKASSLTLEIFVDNRFYGQLSSRVKPVSKKHNKTETSRFVHKSYYVSSTRLVQ